MLKIRSAPLPGQTKSGRLLCRSLSFVRMPQSTDARCFFTRYESRLVPCRCLFAVPWHCARQRGHGSIRPGPGLHFVKCGENQHAVAHPRRIHHPYYRRIPRPCQPFFQFFAERGQRGRGPFCPRCKKNLLFLAEHDILTTSRGTGTLRRVLLQRAVGGCDTARGDAAARLGVAGEIRRGRPLARN